MNTTEGNKLIAEFMGSSFKTYKKGHIRKDIVTVCYFDDGMSPFSGGVSIENLKYHASWDWLMPVVEKIENLNFTTDVCYTHLHKHTATIGTKSGETICRIGCDTKIEAVWLVMCEFIKWDNKNK